MRVAIFAFAITAFMLSVAVSEEEDINAPDRLYVISNSAFYGASETTCAATEWKLATLPTASERAELVTYLNDQKIAKVWIGAKLNSTRVECKRPQKFRKDCWIWDGLGNATKIVEEGGFMWDPLTENKKQNSMSRAYFDVALEVLNFEDNTRVNPAVCEKEPAPDQTTNPPPCECPIPRISGASGCKSIIPEENQVQSVEDSGKCEMSGFNSANMKTDSVPRSIFISTASAYYGTAEQDCNSLSGVLAVFTCDADVLALTEATKNLTISKAWVGAKVSDRPECKAYKKFDKKCWEWVGWNPGCPIDESVISWNKDTQFKFQNGMSRAYFEQDTGTLNFEDNSRLNRYICLAQNKINLRKLRRTGNKIKPTKF